MALNYICFNNVEHWQTRLYVPALVTGKKKTAGFPHLIINRLCLVCSVNKYPLDFPCACKIHLVEVGFKML